MSVDKNDLDKHNKKAGKWITSLMAFLGGFIICGVLIINVMPSLMIVTKECKLGFDQTVEQLQKRIVDEGWSIKGIKDISKEINDAGYDFNPRIKLIKLCKPEYAKSVLATDRHISCMMPCTMAVWQGDNGKVYLSEMNMSLMAKMFGGNISKIMGGHVAEDEKKMLEDLLK